MVDCSYLSDENQFPDSFRNLDPNPDISGNGVLIGFIGTGCFSFLLLVVQYLMGSSEDTKLDGFANPVDKKLLSFIWRYLGKPSGRYKESLKNAILAMSDTQIVTGLSILASGFSQLNSGLDIFHWNIVAYLAWFSSVTHLCTLIFLRRYFQTNPGIRMLRMILMLLLVITLVVALLPTGGACGLQYHYRWGVYPGTPAKCCFLSMGMGTNRGFAAQDGSSFPPLIMSEALVIISSSTRAIKLFRTSSDFARMWSRHKPAQLCKRFAGKLEERYKRSSRRLTRLTYYAGHCSIVTFILLARGFYDVADSILWETSWLLFSLAWGTVRILGIKTYDAPREITNKEGVWGFGQFVPTLLLIILLVSLIEGVLGSNNPKTSDCASVSSNSTSDVTVSNTATVAESEEELGPREALPTNRPSLW